MTALEKIKDMIDFCDAVGCHRALYESLKAVESELEALQQPKSCYDCKHWFPNKASYPCNQCSMAINCLFEPKELKMMEEDAQQYALKCRKELEALQQRSCESCRYWDFNEQGHFKKCFNGKGNVSSTEDDFCCNRYEPKEQ